LQRRGGYSGHAEQQQVLAALMLENGARAATTTIQESGAVWHTVARGRLQRQGLSLTF